jgi:hypothetical protein
MEAPTFTKKPKKADVKEGATATFECTAKGKPVPDVTCMLGDKEAAPSDKVKVTCQPVNGSVNVTVVIDSCQPEDVCEVKFVAKNPAGEATCSAPLAVQGESLIAQFHFISVFVKKCM